GRVLPCPALQSADAVGSRRGLAHSPRGRRLQRPVRRDALSADTVYRRAHLRPGRGDVAPRSRRVAGVLAPPQIAMGKAMTTLLYTHPLCLEHDPGSYHPESPARLQAVLAALAAPE